tara:strand:+ start:179 stop:709 length:531 start_codon:yes stop_codon:yes gene_type:complete
MKNIFTPILASTWFLLGFNGAIAGTYEALCDKTKCTIFVNAGQISSPYGIIPAKRVTQWGSTGKSKTNISTGITTSVLLGPIGLLGFFAKHHDYNFLVNGYNKLGKKTSLQFRFKNNKPLERLITEMSSVTGLGMGETRTALEIKKNEGLERKCWWGKSMCPDELEGKAIDPDVLF